MSQQYFRSSESDKICFRHLVNMFAFLSYFIDVQFDVCISDICTGEEFQVDLSACANCVTDPQYNTTGNCAFLQVASELEEQAVKNCRECIYRNSGISFCYHNCFVF